MLHLTSQAKALTKNYFKPIHEEQITIMASSIMPNRPKSILIIRLSAIGDIVMASGVLPVLRSNWPETQIDWLVQSEYAELLQDNPHLQRVLIWPRKDWQWLWTQKRPFSLIAELRKLIQTLRSQKYDLVLDLQGLWKSAWLAKVCRAQQKIGLDSREGSKWVMSHVCRSQPDKQKMSSEYLCLLQELGLDVQRFYLGLEPRLQEIQSVQAVMQNLDLDSDYALLCPFTTRAQKHWPWQNWVHLCSLLTDRLGLQVVLLGGPRDSTQAEWIQAASSKPVINLAGRISLGQNLALIKQARILIGVDTGITHMAMMSELPSIGLFGSTCPYLYPAGDNGVVLYSNRACSPCRRHPACDAQYPCMQDLEPELVFSTACKLLEGSFDTNVLHDLSSH